MFFFFYKESVIDVGASIIVRKNIRNQPCASLFDPIVIVITIIIIIIIGRPNRSRGNDGRTAAFHTRPRVELFRYLLLRGVHNNAGKTRVHGKRIRAALRLHNFITVIVTRSRHCGICRFHRDNNAGPHAVPLPPTSCGYLTPVSVRFSTATARGATGRPYLRDVCATRGLRSVCSFVT